MRPISGIASRLTAFLLAAALLILAWLGAVSPAIAWKTETADRLAQTQAEEERLRQRIAALEQEIAALSLNETSGIMWSAQQSGEATAIIQDALNRQAARSGLALRSISPTASQPLSHAETVGFKLETEARLDQLVAFLRAVEFQSPPLIIDRAVLRRLNRPPSANGQPVVFVQLDVIAPIKLPEDG